MLRSGKLRLFNWLSLDAPAIALAWYFGLSSYWHKPVEWPTAAVLGLSIWLTYTADRLYDIRNCSAIEALSKRHQFSHLYARLLWKAWWSCLGINLVIAFTLMEPAQMYRGTWLLGFCLIYTGANQLLSKHFFPKEILVSIIFTAGIFIFIDPPYPIILPVLLTLVCFLNCLSIGYKEARIDRNLGIHSIAQWFHPLPAHLCFITCLSLSFFAASSLGYFLLITFIFQWTLYAARKQLDTENFRFLADAALLPAPISLFLISLYS